MRQRHARGTRLGRDAALLASLAACLALPAAARAATETFDHTGAAQSFTVPDDVTELTVDAYGGVGGSTLGTVGPVAGGFGGRATATIPVTPGEVLEVNVGGGGANGMPFIGSSAGGFNGGGDVSGCVGSDDAGAGGGASDLRRDADGAGGDELDERLVVGGGGGGADDFDFATGGSGGGATGDPAGDPTVPGVHTPASGGTQSAGGEGATVTGGTNGGPGQLGAGADSMHCAAGGGGGLYGGGSGGSAGGAGGGSGFTPAGTGMANGVSGGGQVVLSYTVPDGTTPSPDGTTPPIPSEFTRTLGIAYSERKEKFRGKLGSQSPACASGQKVKVFEQEKGKDPKLGSDATDHKGKYSLKEKNADGKFYAEVKLTGISGETCLAAKSKTIKVG